MQVLAALALLHALTICSWAYLIGHGVVVVLNKAWQSVCFVDMAS